MAHRTNLAVDVLSDLPIVGKIEQLVEALYKYFCRSPKRNDELIRLAAVLETSGNKMLQNVSMRWISILDPMSRVLQEYKTLVVKMS